MKGTFLKGIDPGRARIWAVVAMGGLLLLLLGGTLGGSGVSTGTASTQGHPEVKSVSGASADPILALEGQMDHAAETALQRIAGAGRVVVAITLARTDKLEVADNVATSQSSGGSGKSASTQAQSTHTAVTGQSGQPLVIDQTAPRIAGVLIVSSGAHSPLVREALTQAAQTLFDLPAYRVLVLEGGR